jgi:RNA 3'-terminal phosphate cyclase-like protein
MAPFAKNPCDITLHGITNGVDEVTVDLLRTATLPHLKLFGVEDGVELKVCDPGKLV